MSHLNRELAISAYRWMSHTSERRADSDLAAYEKHLADITAYMDALAKNDEQKAVAADLLVKFKADYKHYVERFWSASSRTASPMITGPARFPVERNRKAMSVADERGTEFGSWLERFPDYAEKQLLKARTPEQAASDEWEALRIHIADRLASIGGCDEGRSPWARTAILTNMAGQIERLAANGKTEIVSQAVAFVREQQADMAKPVYTERHSFWNLPEAAALALEKAKTATGQADVAANDEARIIENRDADRVQIVFAAIPNEGRRETLKRSGWKWSPSNKAWQRKLTPNAVYSARQILGLS